MSKGNPALATKPNDYFLKPPEVQKYDVGVSSFDPNFDEFYGIPDAVMIGKDPIGPSRKFKPTMFPHVTPAVEFQKY
jgi:hypothetical protein